MCIARFCAVSSEALKHRRRRRREGVGKLSLTERAIIKIDVAMAISRIAGY